MENGHQNALTEMVKIIGHNGESIPQALVALLERIKRKILTTAKSKMGFVLAYTTRKHFREKYPGSSHWSPSKVTIGGSSMGQNYATGQANVDVAGASRAYHDLTIRPKIRQNLTIPIHRSAMGKSASDFNGLFVVKSKKTGKSFLARRDGGLKKSIQFLYVLIGKEGVHQAKDETLMPSDNTLAENIFREIKNNL